MRMSEILRQILAKHNQERVFIYALAHDLHKQGMPLLMAIFSIPVCIPVPYPPGFSTAVAVCITVFALQLLFQRSELWIPKWFAARTVSRTLVDAIIAKALPKLEKFEHLFKPRWEFLVTPGMQRLVAVIALVMNFVIATPVPGIHFFPGWAIVVMCLGLLNRDGKVVAIGMGVAIWGIVFGWGEIWLGSKAIKALFG